MASTKQFVQRLIDRGCKYCRAQNDECKMTLDRINNAKGHLRTNVMPACACCNYLRRDMPFKAWMFLVPHIRAARKRGLFGEWNKFGLVAQRESSRSAIGR